MKRKLHILFTTLFTVIICSMFFSCQNDEPLVIEAKSYISINISHAESKVEFPSKFGALIEIEKIGGNTTIDSISFIEQTNSNHRTEGYIEVPIEKQFIIKISTNIGDDYLFGSTDTLILEDSFSQPLSVELFLSTGEIVVETNLVNSIGSASAICHGELLDNGGFSINRNGFVWNTSNNPTVDNNLGRSNNGTEMGSFQHTISGLTENTTYYVRSYCTNLQETGYGNSIEFTTLPSTGSISIATGSITPLSATSVEVNGMILDDGGNIINQKGVVWGLAPDVNLINCLEFSNEGSGPGDFSTIITGLSASSTYNVKTYVITATEDTVYSSQMEFSTPASALPDINTVSTILVLPYTAIIQSQITSNGGTPISAKGVVYGTSPSPDITINEGLTNEGSGTGEFVSNISGLTPGDTYYVRAYATNQLGTAYGNELSFTTKVIGDTGPGGGFIFYLDGVSGGMEVSKVDTEVSMQWGCSSILVNAMSSLIGAGITNTNTIVTFHDELPYYYENPTQCDDSNDGTVAAKYCSDFSQNGFDDWFLPSLDELTEIHNNLHGVGLGDFTDDIYWSSTESTDLRAFSKDFWKGTDSDAAKFGSYKVRAVRKF